VNPKIDKSYYAGSAALTTAFCLEALSKYLIVTESKEGKETRVRTIIEKTQLHKQIMQKVEKRLLFLDKTTHTSALGTLDKMLENDPQQQITLLCYYFAQALGDKKKNITDDFITNLGMANVFGWLAYTIYDDFFDEEGDPRLLSIANIALRSVCEIYEKILPRKSGFTEIFHNIMDTLDYANAWEAANCRITISNKKFIFKNIVIPDFLNYDILAQKSLGHALGPVAILFSLGYKKNSPEVKKLLLFFKHYLIARQLNDDAHDWEQDLLRGYCNSVGSLLLKKYHQKLSKSRKSIKREEYIAELHKLFWYEVITEVCTLIQHHTQLARNALYDCFVIVDHRSLEQMIITYEKAAWTALNERKKALKFLETYTSTES